MQAVSISLQDQNLSFNCSYAENSTAQGCQVTMCLRRGGQVVSNVCGTFTSLLTSPIGSIRVSVVGNYVVTSVADIEEDGSTNIVGNIAVFGALETSPPTSIPATASSNMSVGMSGSGTTSVAMRVSTITGEPSTREQVLKAADSTK